MSKWKRNTLFALVVLGAQVCTAFAFDAVPAAGQLAGGLGYPLTVNSNVAESSSIEAVLIPARIAQHIFGPETAKNYIVIELIVSNHNPQASLVIQSIFLDYSNWLLGRDKGADVCTGGNPVSSDAASTQRLTCPAQIGAAEYRLVRAELLDRQPFTTRNILINSATAAGSIATAFAFPFSKDVVAGISAWNGGLLPAVNTMFPDGTINQLNHISDFGFQTNKVIPKQASDIVVAFFPIDRLLTKSLGKIYRDDPAIFFVPGELTIEPKYDAKVVKLIQSYYPDFTAKQLVQVHNADCPKPQTTGAGTDPSEFCQIKKFLGSIALNNLQVGIGGDMTVSITTVPPTITSVSFPSSGSSTFWEPSSTGQTGSILGTYLTGAIPAVVDQNGSPIPEITISTVSAGATDSNLPVKIVVSKCIPPKTEVYFQLSKQISTSTTQSNGSSGSQSNTNQVTSMRYDFGNVPAAQGCSQQ